MREFHFSDLLSVTTGRLVSNRHMDGLYDILNFLTGDNLFTHQLPRAMNECKPWLSTQFPKLMEDSPEMAELLGLLDEWLEERPTMSKSERKFTIDMWVLRVREDLGYPEMVPVYEMGADMHTRIDPVEELRAMVGDEKVIVIGDVAER